MEGGEGSLRAWRGSGLSRKEGKDCILYMSGPENRAWEGERAAEGLGGGADSAVKRARIVYFTCLAKKTGHERGRGQPKGLEGKRIQP